MVTESEKHKVLKRLSKAYFEAEGYEVFTEYSFKHQPNKVKVYLSRYKLVDIFGLKGRERLIGECIVTQRFKDVSKKLERLKKKDIRVVIIRFKKKRNPLANKIIEGLKQKGIELIEF